MDVVISFAGEENQAKSHNIFEKNLELNKSVLAETL